MLNRWLLGGFAIIVAASGYAQGRKVDLQVKPVWGGLAHTNPFPCYIEIENNGGSTQGVVTEAAGNQVRVEYPIELPSGAKKRILAFSEGYGDVTFTLRTPFGITDSSLKLGYGGGSAATYGLISDNPSDADFLRGSEQNGTDRGGVSVGGCRPEDAPDRLNAYQCLDVLILGDGTDRMRDSQVQAIREYALSGGSLLLIGGAARSASADARWSDIAPVTNLALRNVPSPLGQMTVLEGSIARGKALELSLGSGAVVDYGLGQIAFLSVNPFEEPVRRYASRRALLIKSTNRFRTQAVGNFIAPALATNYTASSLPSGVAKVADPFQIAPPTAGQLGVVLVIYILVVIPINFAILRKMKRVELAWISVPLISLIFTLLLLRSTVALYKATATTRTTGFVTLDGTGKTGIAFAKAEMFFPSAGTHDLKLTSTTGLYSPRTSENQYYGGQNESTSLNMVDDGDSLIAPSCDTTNLAFREFAFVQRTDSLKGITCTATKAEGKYRVTLRNGSKTKLSSVSVFTPSGSIPPIPTMLAGQEKTIEVPLSALVKKQGDASTSSTLVNTLVLPIVVQFVANDVRLGPEFGSRHSGSSTFGLIHPIEVKP